MLRSHGSGVQNVFMATGMEVVILVWGKNVVVGGRFGGVHMVALSQWGHNGGRFFREVAISGIWGVSTATWGPCSCDLLDLASMNL